MSLSQRALPWLPYLSWKAPVNLPLEHLVLFLCSTFVAVYCWTPLLGWKLLEGRHCVCLVHFCKPNA